MNNADRNERKPRLLDLFCGAGGCAKGYQRAGFYVVGVDIAPQPRYAGDFFWQTDAMKLLEMALSDGPANTFVLGSRVSSFSVIHASPPCQDYSKALRHMAAPQPRLIEPVRDALVRIGLPWVIENVEGAPIPKSSDLFGSHGIQLCGTSFGLKVWRHRLFESSVPMVAPDCEHKGHAMNPHNVAGRRRIYAEFGKQDPEILWKREMGVEWMGRYEAREAVPPVFTEWIGNRLMAHMRGGVAA
jgi:DNA (cytosine-5)-methyltransferase 1